MRTWNRGAFLLLLAITASAACVAAQVEVELPEPTETPGPTPTASAGNLYGRGIDGTVTADSGNEVDNDCVPVAGTGTSFVFGTSTGPRWSVPGRRVLLHHTAQAFLDVDTDNETSSPGESGSWDILPIASVTGTALLTTVSTSHTYPAASDQGVAQACLVLEFENLTVEIDVRPPAWNGTTGGILAFFVSSNLTLDANRWFDVTGNGFRGGSSTGDNGTTVLTWDTTAAQGGAKGEGNDVRSYTRFGYGSYRLAGGGGNLNNAGGGGGAGRGDGGDGGTASGVGGLGGTAMAFTPSRSRLFFGGGGGGGHHANGATGLVGGKGGGIIFGGARRIVHAGSPSGFRAGGEDPTGSSPTGAVGGSGGGGGGTVLFWSSSGAASLSCEVGGRFGNAGLNGGGTGGGGGGGACWVDVGVYDIDGGGGANLGAVGEIVPPDVLPQWW